jgi:hypothetical protein
MDNYIIIYNSKNKSSEFLLINLYNNNQNINNNYIIFDISTDSIQLNESNNIIIDLNFDLEFLYKLDNVEKYIVYLNYHNIDEEFIINNYSKIKKTIFKSLDNIYINMTPSDLINYLTLDDNNNFVNKTYNIINYDFYDFIKNFYLCTDKKYIYIFNILKNYDYVFDHIISFKLSKLINKKIIYNLIYVYQQFNFNPIFNNYFQINHYDNNFYIDYFTGYKYFNNNQYDLSTLNKILRNKQGSNINISYIYDNNFHLTLDSFNITLDNNGFHNINYNNNNFLLGYFKINISLNDYSIYLLLYSQRQYRYIKLNIINNQLCLDNQKNHDCPMNKYDSNDYISPILLDNFKVFYFIWFN